MGRWARLAMTLVVAAAVVVATLTLVLRPTSVPTRFVTVKPGDTLASIAVGALPDLGRADALAVIESLNGLDGPTVQVGAVLRVPTGDGGH
jgi:LysM repeat protein